MFKKDENKKVNTKCSKKKERKNNNGGKDLLIKLLYQSF